MEFSQLKDLELKSVTFTEEDLLINLTNGKTIKYTAVGDCCSSSYIESLDNPEALQNTLLISTEEVQGEQKEMDYETHKWTFYKFKTTKGDCTLSFRNESNGYYNGYLSFSGEST